MKQDDVTVPQVTQVNSYTLVIQDLDEQFHIIHLRAWSEFQEKSVSNHPVTCFFRKVTHNLSVQLKSQENSNWLWPILLRGIWKEREFLICLVLQELVFRKPVWGFLKIKALDVFQVWHLRIKHAQLTFELELVLELELGETSCAKCFIQETAELNQDEYNGSRQLN